MSAKSVSYNRTSINTSTHTIYITMLYYTNEYIQGLIKLVCVAASRVPQSMSCRVRCSRWMCLKAMLLLLLWLLLCPLPAAAPAVCRCSPAWVDTKETKAQGSSCKSSSIRLELPPDSRRATATVRPVNWASMGWVWPWWHDWVHRAAAMPRQSQSVACSGWDAAAAATVPDAASSPAWSPSVAPPSRTASCCSCAPMSSCYAQTLDLVFENLQGELEYNNENRIGLFIIVLSACF